MIADQVPDLLARLSSIPSRINRVVHSWLSTELYVRREGKEAWSAIDILAHVRASEDILTSRAYAILTRDEPLLLAYDERRWAEVARYHQTDFHLSLALFTLKRAELVAMLSAIAPSDWQRVGIHEVHGSCSLLNIVIALLEHEEEHCTQLEGLHLTQ